MLFRSKEYLPESLVFHDNYLGTGQALLGACADALICGLAHVKCINTHGSRDA